MQVARVLRWMLALGGGFALLSLILIFMNWVLGGPGEPTAGLVDLQARLSGPDGPLPIVFSPATGGEHQFGAAIQRSVTLTDAGWPFWLDRSIVLARQALLAGGLLWAASALGQIGRGQGLTVTVGRRLIVAGSLLTAAEGLRALMITVVSDNVDKALHTRHGGLPPEVTATLTQPTTAFTAAVLLALTVIVLGVVIKQTAPIVEEHELTV